MKELLDKSRNLIRLWIASFAISIALGVIDLVVKIENFVFLIVNFLFWLVFAIVIIVKEFKLLFFLRRRGEAEEKWENKEKIERLRKNIRNVLIFRLVLIFLHILLKALFSSGEEGQQDKQMLNYLSSNDTSSIVFGFLAFLMGVAVRIPFFLEFKRIKEQEGRGGDYGEAEDQYIE